MSQAPGGPKLADQDFVPLRHLDLKCSISAPCVTCPALTSLIPSVKLTSSDPVLPVNPNLPGPTGPAVSLASMARPLLARGRNRGSLWHHASAVVGHCRQSLHVCLDTLPHSLEQPFQAASAFPGPIRSARGHACPCPETSSLPAPLPHHQAQCSLTSACAQADFLSFVPILKIEMKFT